MTLEVKIYVCEICQYGMPTNFTICPECHYNHSTKRFVTKEELVGLLQNDICS